MMIGWTLMAALAVVTPEWVHAWMVKLQPEAVTPWNQTYQETAVAIAEAANEDNLFPQKQDGAYRTASLLVAIAWFESRFNPTAIGDNGTAFGLFQIHADASPGIMANELLLPRDAARVALRLVRTSFRVCRGEPAADRLSWYARGGNGCSDKGHKHSENRMHLADRILKEEP